MDRKRRSVEREFLSQSLTLCDLSTMDTDKNGLVDRAEFLSYMLVALQKVSRDDVREILDLFSQLDVDGTNFLNKDDLLARDWDSSLRSSMSRASN
jgi:Ca2+-binding EF-hand superfamily protein